MNWCGHQNANLFIRLAWRHLRKQGSPGYGHLTTNYQNWLRLYVLHIFVYILIFDGNALPGIPCDAEQILPLNTPVMWCATGMRQ